MCGGEPLLPRQLPPADRSLSRAMFGPNTALHAQQEVPMWHLDVGCLHSPRPHAAPGWGTAALACQRTHSRGSLCCPCRALTLADAKTNMLRSYSEQQEACTHGERQPGELLRAASLLGDLVRRAGPTSGVGWCLALPMLGMLRSSWLPVK